MIENHENKGEEEIEPGDLGCVICESPHREGIEKLLSKPRSKARITREFGFHWNTIQRHVAHMLPKDADKRSTTAVLDALIAKAEKIEANAKSDKAKLDAIARVQSLRMDRERLAQQGRDDARLETHPVVQQIVGELADIIGECATCTGKLRRLRGGDTRS